MQRAGNCPSLNVCDSAWEQADLSENAMQVTSCIFGSFPRSKVNVQKSLVSPGKLRSHMYKVYHFPAVDTRLARISLAYNPNVQATVISTLATGVLVSVFFTRARSQASVASCRISLPYDESRPPFKSRHRKGTGNGKYPETAVNESSEILKMKWPRGVFLSHTVAFDEPFVNFESRRSGPVGSREISSAAAVNNLLERDEL